MAIKQRQVFETSDGKLFLSQEEAMGHEQKIGWGFLAKEAGIDDTSSDAPSAQFTKALTTLRKKGLIFFFAGEKPEEMVASRRRIGLEQQILAKRIGISQITLSSAETGRSNLSDENFQLWQLAVREAASGE